MGIASCDYKTASAKVKTMDQERKNYYQYYTGRQWGYAGNYDLCVNTFFYGHDETIQVLYENAAPVVPLAAVCAAVSAASAMF